MQKSIGYFRSLNFGGMVRAKWLLFFLILSLPGRAQSRNDKIPIKLRVTMEQTAENKNFIVYAMDRPLEVADFKGKADRTSHGVAATFSGIQMAFSGEEKARALHVDVKLLVYFDQTKSWTKKEGRSAVVLAHEQIHFDITAIFACAFAKAVREYPFTPKNIKEELRVLNRRFVENMQRTQDNYDRETAHGTLEEKQAEWSAKIRSQLDKLNCYRGVLN